MTPTWIPENLRQVVLGIQIWQALGLVLAIAVGWLVGWLTRRLLIRLFRARMAEWHNRMPESHRRGVGRWSGALIGTYTIAAIWRGLSFPEAWDRPLMHVGLAAILFTFLALCLRLWDVACDDLLIRSSDNARAERLLIPLTRKLGRVLIVMGGLLLALANFGVNVTGLLAGLGIGGLVVALAAKDSVENVFGSLTVMLDMPFAIGDWVKIGDVEGIVEEINLRSTRIRTFADSLVSLPNSNLIKASVENLGRRRYRRTVVELVMTNSNPPEQVESFLSKARESLKQRSTLVQEKSTLRLTGLQDGHYVATILLFLDVPDLATEQAEREAILLEILQMAHQQQLDLGRAPAPPGV
ncbi:MAG TPA: mechanosensitive ion channel [Fimbriimonadaceae bacterium]|nr:mechanosensitive ion channel [Fimbriimonadaceae bacterium]HRJ32371.1 mechanosensitive ion channel [Fimbriimonadaceae bacterium]